MMFSSSRNVELICQLIKDIREYGSLRLERFELDMASRLAIALGLLVVGAVLMVLAALVLVFVSLAVGFALAPVVGSTALAMLIVAAAYVVVAILVYAKRNTWIVTPLTLFLHELFIGNQSKS